MTDTEYKQTKQLTLVLSGREQEDWNVNQFAFSLCNRKYMRPSSCYSLRKSDNSCWFMKLSPSKSLVPVRVPEKLTSHKLKPV